MLTAYLLYINDCFTYFNSESCINIMKYFQIPAFVRSPTVHDERKVSAFKIPNYTSVAPSAAAITETARVSTNT